jgi:hypothetical protein
MGLWQNLKGTTQNLFRIGKNKWRIDASAATALRDLKLGNAEIDFTNPSINQFLKFDGTKWLPSAGGGGGSGYTEIAANGNIGGTYEGNVLCLGNVTLNNNLVVKGDLFVIGNFVKPQSSSSYDITIYGNFTVLGYFDYKSSSGTPNFNINGDFTVIGEILHEEKFTPISVGKAFLAQDFNFSHQGGYSDLVVSNVIDSDNFQVNGDVTTEVYAGSHITYNGITYTVVSSSYDGTFTNIQVTSHPFSGSETFRTLTRQFLTVNYDHTTNSWLQAGDIIYFSNNDYATISNLNWNGTDLEITLSSQNFTGNTSTVSFSSFRLDRKKVFYLPENVGTYNDYYVETGPAAGTTFTLSSFSDTNYDSTFDLRQYRLATPLTNEIQQNNIIKVGRDKFFRTNKYLQFEETTNKFSANTELLPWFAQKRVKRISTNEINFANGTDTKWDLDSINNEYNQLLDFITSFSTLIQLSDIFAIEIPSSIVIETANTFTFNIKGNLKLVNCFWTKTGDENGTNKQQGMKLIVGGDIICRNDTQNTNQSYWNNIKCGPLIQASGTDNYNLTTNTAGDGGEIICGGDIKGISIYACGGNQFNGQNINNTLPQAGKGGKIICKNFIGRSGFDLTNGSPIPVQTSEDGASSIWLNGGYAIRKKQNNASAIANDTNDNPVTIGGHVICSIFSVNGGSCLNIAGHAGFGGTAKKVVINGNLQCHVISWCGGRGSTINNGGTASGSNGTMTNFYVNGNVNAFVFYASSGININNAIDSTNNAQRNNITTIPNVEIKGDLILDLNDFEAGFIGSGKNFNTQTLTFPASSSNGTSLLVNGKFIGHQIRTKGGDLIGFASASGSSGNGGSVLILNDVITIEGVITSSGYCNRIGCSVGASGNFTSRGTVMSNNQFGSVQIITRSGNAVNGGQCISAGNGGSVTILGKLIGIVNTDGGISNTATTNGGLGGNITITTLENISTTSATLSAKGGSSSNNGGNGGTININFLYAPKIIIDASGGNGATGGLAGEIYGINWTCESIIANSGDSTNGNSVNGGIISFPSNGYINCSGAISAKAGDVSGGTNRTTGNGGNITLPSGKVGSITNNGGNNNITSGPQSNCGKAGDLIINGNLLVTGDINCNGGNHSTTGTAGNAGNATENLTVNGTLVLSGNINAKGGSRQNSSGNANAGRGGLLTFNRPVFCNQTINVEGGSNNASSTAGAGGNVKFLNGASARRLIGTDGAGTASSVNVTVEFNGVCKFSSIEFTNRTGVKFRSNVSSNNINATLIAQFSGKNRLADNTNTDQATTISGTQILNYTGTSWRTYGEGTAL